jgi:hypothetical protein
MRVIDRNDTTKNSALAGGPAALDRAVAPQQLIASQQSYQEDLVGHVEEDRQRPDREGDHQQRRQAEPAEDRGDHDSGQRQGPAEVGQHHHGPGPPSVHPGAGEQRQQQDRRLADRAELA